MPLGDERRIERLRQAHDHGVVWAIEPSRVPKNDGVHIGAVDQSFAPQEPYRELVLVARRSHRDRDGDRLLTRAGGPDLERLLAHDGVTADLELATAHGDDP